jgi:hypothetical protein
MVTLHSIAATGADTASVIADLDDQIRARSAVADFVYAFYGCDHDDDALRVFLQDRFPGAAILGGTSCTGVMTERRLWGAGSIGLLLIDDPAGDYGAASARLGDDPAATAERLLRAALGNAGCPGELPELIWVYQAPGHEEEVIDGLRRVVSDRCPIIGGSSADDTVAGNWRQLGADGVLTDGLVVGVLFPSGGIGYAFQGGYEPAGPHGVVTRVGASRSAPDGAVSRGREIISIDHKPAAQVYNAWTGHALDGKVADGGNVLLETTMFPLGIDAGHVAGIPHFLLIHPQSITRDGALLTFAEIEEGTRIYSMRGDKNRLVERAGHVAGEATSLLSGGAGRLAGGLVIYCAGCMLAVGDRMPDVTHEIRRGFPDAPFLACFTFGEQGSLVDRNVHGNLMISAIAFGR